MNNLHINSEIGSLKKIMLHRPGYELERISPNELREVLFEDIPWMTRMKQEHDLFAKVLKENDAKVFYVLDKFLDVLNEEDKKEAFINYLLNNEIDFSNKNKSAKEELSEYLNSLNPNELSRVAVGGSDFLDMNLKPLPNLYFVRDISAVIANGVMLSKMKNSIRNRESIIMNFIFKYHKDLGGSKIHYDNMIEKGSIEGGDVLVLNEKSVIIGCSERTKMSGIKKLAKNLFKDGQIERVIVIDIPNERACMHLDTAFTMIDYDKFLIFPNILKRIEVTTITQNGKTLSYEKEISLEKALEKGLNIKGVNIIKSGGEDEILAAREQWNDSTNTLCIAPGKVITYNRNEITNEILDKNNIKVVTIEGSELVRGRGGPRCMSMPLYREKAF